MDLRRRLLKTRWPDQPIGVDWRWGTERTLLDDVIRSWADDYQWRSQELLLNTLP